jgi:SAM-dependent methyltransferase
MQHVTLIKLALASIITVFAVDSSYAQHGHKEGGKGGHHHHQRFDDPAVWSKSFDDPARDAWQKPEDVIRALALKSDARVADIGAGTGYFTVRLARAVPGGQIFAVDIEHKMVDHIVARAKDAGLTNIRGVVAREASASLPEAIDLALMVNSYHHIEGRTAYMRDLARTLRPGGRIAIVEARPEADQGPPKHFRLSIAQIDKEMSAAGFKRTGQHDFLPRQNLLIYEVAAK